MASKLGLLIQGLLVMVVLISSTGEARHLVEVATKQNNMDRVKYCAQANDKVDGDVSSDCFMIPGLPTWPSIPGFGWPGTTNQPVTPTTPLIPTPVTPTTPLTPSPPKIEVATKKNDVDSVKYCTKTNSVKGNGDASYDCFIPHAPGVPGLPWWLWPFTPSPPATPVTPSPPESPSTPSPPESPSPSYI